RQVKADPEGSARACSEPKIFRAQNRKAPCSEPQIKSYQTHVLGDGTVRWRLTDHLSMRRPWTALMGLRLPESDLHVSDPLVQMESTALRRRPVLAVAAIAVVLTASRRRMSLHRGTIPPVAGGLQVMSENQALE
ncbi:MAG: hypothetical protein ACOX69_08460, partial [Coriobacteriales bacterium]